MSKVFPVANPAAVHLVLIEGFRVDATLLDFVVRYERVEIHRSARRHGVDDDDVTHAVARRLVIDDLGEKPDRWLVIGPDRAGNLLEIVVPISSDGDEFIIHAMSMRPKYRKLLES